MASDLVGAALIEAYLSARQVRYFRGHHDDEFFFLINAYHGRLHVHLEVPATDREVITISIAEERYYPATLRGRLTGLVDEWNKATPWAKAALVASSDPNLLGIAAHNRYSRKIGDFDGGRSHASIGYRTVRSRQKSCWPRPEVTETVARCRVNDAALTKTG